MYLIEEVDSSVGFDVALESAGYLNPFNSQTFVEFDRFIKGVGAVGGNQNGGAENLGVVA